jgi:hypothetical protein
LREGWRSKSPRPKIRGSVGRASVDYLLGRFPSRGAPRTVRDAVWDNGPECLTTAIASAIEGCVIPLSRSNTIWIRWRCSSALSLSRPAQASLTLRPAGSLSRPQATFVTRLQPMRLPTRAARQLPDQSTTLRVDSSSTDDSRLRGALPIPDSCTAAKPAILR